jgi:hypothetical protein
MNLFRRLFASEKRLENKLRNLENLFPPPRTEAIVKQIIATRKELAAYLSYHTTPCTACGNKPHVMKRREEVYEVGCLAHHVTTPTRGVGKTAKEAVKDWNSKNK